MSRISGTAAGSAGAPNVDPRTVEDFGREWTTFDQSELGREERERSFAAYFAVFPWDRISRAAVGFDFGCGSGRWAGLVAPRVGRLHCVDASEAALVVARRNLADRANCEFHLATAEDLPFPDSSMDFGYSLGVLHHLPDPVRGLSACVRKLRPDAPFLLYVYYRFDNRPAWFRRLWQASDLLRRALSRAPHEVKLPVSGLIAATVYWPLARIARAIERRGVDVSAFPLSFYRNSSFYTMRTDALDRFGTRVEFRFTRDEIRSMMEQAGLEHVAFGEMEPFWCAVGRKRRAAEPSAA